MYMRFSYIDLFGSLFSDYILISTWGYSYAFSYSSNSVRIALGSPKKSISMQNMDRFDYIFHSQCCYDYKIFSTLPEKENVSY